MQLCLLVHHFDCRWRKRVCVSFNDKTGHSVRVYDWWKLLCLSPSPSVFVRVTTGCRTGHVAVCGSVAVCCRVLQCVAVCCSVLQCVVGHFLLNQCHRVDHVVVCCICRLEKCIAHPRVQTPALSSAIITTHTHIYTAHQRPHKLQHIFLVAWGRICYRIPQPLHFWLAQRAVPLCSWSKPLPLRLSSPTSWFLVAHSTSGKGCIARTRALRCTISSLWNALHTFLFRVSSPQICSQPDESGYTALAKPVSPKIYLITNSFVAHCLFK